MNSITLRILKALMKAVVVAINCIVGGDDDDDSTDETQR